MSKFLLAVCLMFSVIGCESLKSTVYECPNEVLDQLDEFTITCIRWSAWTSARQCLETGKEIYCTPVMKFEAIHND